MAEQSLTAVAEVPASDLVIIKAALNSAYHFSLVTDLAEQYRKLNQRPTPSKMTKALEGSLDLLTSYIESAHEEPDEPVQ